MNIPVVLPVARIHINDAGQLEASLDGERYAESETLRRSDLPRLLEDITRGLQAPVRVEVTEADGTTYFDIATPSDRPLETEMAQTGDEPMGAGVRGTGFRPGERVAVAYVLVHETADAKGTTALRLPAAALGRRPGALLLFGLDSRIGTLIGDPA